MSRISADQIQKPGGTAFSLPVASGTTDQYVQTDGNGNLTFTQPQVATGGDAGLVCPENTSSLNVGSIVTHTDRYNTYSTGEWTSDGPWTTFTAYSSENDTNGTMFFNMALGDGMGNASTTTERWLADSENELPRRLQFSNGNRLGYMRDVFHYDNATSYAGHSFRIMPLRNTTAAAVTVPVYGYCSQYWGAGYEGCQMMYWTPNTSKYSTVTSGTGTSVSQSTSNARQVNMGGSVTIPANTTVLVCLISTDCYNTTYRFKDTNYFYDLKNTVDGANGIICDMVMLTHLAKGNMKLPYTGACSTSIIPLIYNSCAAQWGDR